LTVGEIVGSQLMERSTSSELSLTVEQREWLQWLHTNIVVEPGMELSAEQLQQLSRATSSDGPGVGVCVVSRPCLFVTGPCIVSQD
jgi:hypothetical protein